MNKQELIEKYESLKGIWNNPGSIPALECFLRDLYQLSEPQKVVIPRFVAEWIAYCKEKKFTLLGAIDPVGDFGEGLGDTFEGKLFDVLRWIKENLELFARAWLDGYEVEKEKRYWVKDKDGQHLLYKTAHGEIIKSTANKYYGNILPQYTFTEKEIKDYDERFWAFAELVEVKND